MSVICRRPPDPKSLATLNVGSYTLLLVDLTLTDLVQPSAESHLARLEQSVIIWNRI